MDLVPPQCDACGAPVPLSDGALATCVRCESTVAIDAAHRALRQAAQAARARRREAEAKLRRMERRLPPWLLPAYVLTVIPTAVIGTIVGFALTQSEYGWFAREWVVLAGILPFMIALLPALIIWSLGNPQAYIRALGIELRPAPPRPDAVGVGCGLCGAPLCVEVDAYAATCDYCGADSWVRPMPDGYDHGADERREAANLADLLHAQRFQSFDIKLLLVVYTLVTTLVCVGLYLGLPGRAQLDAMRYAQSVNYEWELVGRPGPVVALAVVGDGLIAVGADGRAQVYRDYAWDEIDGASWIGVGAQGERALLVGVGGAAAWLEDGELERVDVGLDVDLHDAWIGADGSAVVVGARGSSALYDGQTWRVLAQTSENDLLAVWGRSADEVYAVGGISVHALVEGEWAYEFLQGLPAIVDVTGDERSVYLATAPLDEDAEPDVWVDVYAWTDEGWDMQSFSGPRFMAIAAGDGALWAVGPGGYVEARGEPPAHPPGPGDLRAVVLWDGAAVVGGDDGVFVHASR